MGSQFVDFNADGHVDYLTATYDGEPMAGKLEYQVMLEHGEVRALIP